MEIIVNNKYKIYKDKYGVVGYNMVSGVDLPKYVLDLMERLK